MEIGKILRGTAVGGAVFLLTAGSVLAATTIGANIDTDGTLDVVGAATIDGTTFSVDDINDAVGIGTATPIGTEASSRLTVEGSDAGSFLTSVINTGTGWVGTVLRRTGGTTSRWVTYIPLGSDSLVFHGNSADRMAIDSNGNVGIGDITPDYLLDVAGTLGVDGNMTLGDAVTDDFTLAAAIQGTSALIFDGSTNDTNETTFSITNPTADRTITFPDASLTVAGTDFAQTWNAAQTFNGGITTATFSVNPATKDPIVIYPLTGSTGDFTGTITSENLTGSSKTWTLPNATGTFCLTSSCLSSSLTDNVADALDVQQGTNNYLNFNTTDSSENVAFGNATTNPSFSFLGSGLLTTGDDITISGNALSFLGSGTISTAAASDLVVNSGTTGTLSLGTGTDAKGVHLGSTGGGAFTNILSGTGAVRLNVDNNQPTNINTGTSSGTVTIGNASANVAIVDPQWAVTGAGAATFASITGPLTGNVTGNVSGTAATVTGAAQAAITSVGTLTGLTMGGTLAMGANSLTFADSGLLDLSAINGSSTSEGLKLPQATDCSASTAEGLICWDTDGDTLAVGNGATVTSIGNPFGASIDAGEVTNDTLDFAQFADAMTIDTVSVSGTWANLGSVTTIDINGGTVDGAVIGGSSAAAGTFTSITDTGNMTFSSGSAITVGSSTQSAASTNSTALTLTSGNVVGTTSDSGAVTLSTGTASNGNTGALIITSGNATGGTGIGGNVLLDTGSGSVTDGTLNLGTLRAGVINIGISGRNTAIKGTMSVAETFTANGSVVLGDGDDIAINSNDWDISSAGAISGVTTVTTSGFVSVGGHLKSTGTAPSTPAGTGCSSASIVGTDTKGTITATFADGAAFCGITFASAYSSTPVCVVSPTNVVAATAALTTSYVSTTTDLTITAGAAVAAGKYNYICIE